VVIVEVGESALTPLLIPNANFPLPLIREILEKLAGAVNYRPPVIYTQIDLQQGFNQFRVDPDDLSLKVVQNEVLVVESGLQASGGVKVEDLKSTQSDRRILSDLIG
jgi:hypothetical protein